MEMPPKRLEKPVHLNRYFHFTEAMRDASVELCVIRYTSTYDGAMQSILLMRPTRSRPKKLFFFLHGMDGDVGDALVVRDIVKRLNATVVASGGRGPSWLSDEFLADAECIIKEFSKGFRGFYIIGISMGATQALGLPALLSRKMRRRLRGVIALLPGSDLEAIANGSSHSRVRKTLKASVKGDWIRLRERSPVNLIHKYENNLPFVVFYNDEDTLLLTEELKKYLIALRRSGHPLAVFSAPGNHQFTYKYFDYVKVFKQLGKASVKRRPPFLRPEY